MTEIRMLRAERGSPNGIKVVQYEAGQTYDLPAALAKAFSDDMNPPAAEYVTAEPVEPPADKDGDNAPRETAGKMVPSAPENKAVLGGTKPDSVALNGAGADSVEEAENAEDGDEEGEDQPEAPTVTARPTAHKKSSAGRARRV